VLYFAQVGLGAFIHWVKPKVYRGRPPQNYLHAIAGIALIVLALYQVRVGYNDEWPKLSGKGKLPRGINVVWEIWIVVSNKLAIAFWASVVTDGQPVNRP
jgi:hypothetical protein